MSITRLLPILLTAAVWAFPAPEPTWDSLENSIRRPKSALVAAGNSVFVGNASGILVSHDKGITWWTTRFEQISVVGGIHSEGKRLFAAAYVEGILLSEDSGFTWKSLALPGDSGDAYRGVFRRDSVLLAGTYYRGIFRSTDTGKTWVRAAGPLNEGIFGFFEALGPTLIAGSHYDGIHLSRDDGKTWQRAGAPLGEGKSIVSLAVDGQRVFAISDRRLFLSPDTGRTWRGLDLDSGMVPGAVMAWKDWILVGTQRHGILYSEDIGVSWKKLGTGLPDTLGANLLAAGEGILYAATTDFTLWRLELSPPGTAVRKSNRGSQPRWRQANPGFPWKVNGRLCPDCVPATGNK